MCLSASKCYVCLAVNQKRDKGPHMGAPPLLKPGLYRAEGSAARPDRPALLGGACANCGYIFFPPQPYGCERCGSLDLEPHVLSGAGTLLASARVHLHAGKSREAPFTVGAIALDDGPVVRTLIVEGDDVLSPGDRMATALAPAVDAEGAPCLDLRFVREA
jgi:uncharacterized OB-fold protein